MDLSHTALNPPPGVPPDFQNHDNIGSTVIVVNAICLVLMVIFLAMRLYVKAIVTRTLWWDDFWIVLGAIGSCVHSVLEMYGTKHGVGTHIWDIPLSHLSSSLIRIQAANNIVYSPIVLFIKLSMILLYHRLFAVNRTMEWITRGAVTFLVLFYVAATCVAIAVEAQCTNPSPYPSLCSNIRQLTVTHSVVNVLTDFGLLLLPITKVFSLHIPLRRKIRVSAIFGIGFLACVASIMRTAFIIKDARNADFTWTGGLLSIFSSIEINVGIIAGCLITFPALAKKYPVGSLGSIGSWSLRSLRRRLLGKSAKVDQPSSAKLARDSFHGIGLHSPTADGFTELGDVGQAPSFSEQGSLQAQKTTRYVTEAFEV